MKTNQTTNDAGLQNSGRGRTSRKPQRIGLFLLASVTLLMTLSSMGQVKPSLLVDYDTQPAGENLQSAYLLRERAAQSWAPGLRPPLQGHFDDVLRILQRDTDQSLRTALARLEASQGASWTSEERETWQQHLAAARERNMAVLREYQARGLFPVNEVDQSRPIPIFVDRQDTACAVGYLMRRSGAGKDVEAIVRANNLVYVTDVQDGPLVDWILMSGLTQEEAALIQPGYRQPSSSAAAVQPDGRYLVITDPIGVFEPDDEPPDDPHSYDWGTWHSAREIARLNPDGSFDKSLEQIIGDLFTVAVQPDGKILAGGWFSEVNGEPRVGLVRLNHDFSVDVSFDARIDSGNVAHMVLQPDGRIVVAGNYLVIAGEPQSKIARLNPDGSLDDEFNPIVEGLSVEALALQPDDKILVGGDFDAVDGQPRQGIARLNPDGTLDLGFDSNLDWVVFLAVQPDGKILVGGNELKRLHADGSLDEEFSQNAREVTALAIQADGRILWGGNWKRGDQPKFGRLLADGSKDSTLSAQTGDISSITLLPHGEILLTGHVEGDFRVHRITNTQPGTEHLSYDGTVITWMRGGTVPEVWRTTFESSTNGTEWALLGTGERMEGGWELAAPDLADDVTIRARGFPSGSGPGSGGILQSYWSSHLMEAPAVVMTNLKHRVTDNRFDFSIAAKPRQTLVVETSSNQVDWTAIATYCYDDAPIRVRGAKSTEQPISFYRVRAQP